MNLLNRAIMIAAETHAGQVDKAGMPYILHPLRVMLQMKTDESRIVAVLHDVVEDGSWDFDALGKEFTEGIVNAIVSVTKSHKESYEVYILRASQNVIGSQVKMADLVDNVDLSRIAKPTKKDYARTERYWVSIRYLKQLIEERGSGE